MRQAESLPNTKALNTLGQAYQKAKPLQQAAFKYALVEIGEKDDTDYWRAFRDNWRYAATINKAPFAIINEAKRYLNFLPTQTPTNNEAVQI